jgi:hypothetical protein
MSRFVVSEVESILPELYPILSRFFEWTGDGYMKLYEDRLGFFIFLNDYINGEVAVEGLTEEELDELVKKYEKIGYLPDDEEFWWKWDNTKRKWVK